MRHNVEQPLYCISDLHLNNMSEMIQLQYELHLCLLWQYMCQKDEPLLIFLLQII